MLAPNLNYYLANNTEHIMYLFDPRYFGYHNQSNYLMYRYFLFHHNKLFLRMFLHHAYKLVLRVAVLLIHSDAIQTFYM